MVKAWAKQSELKKERIPTRQDIKDAAFYIPNLAYRSLFILLYLSGCRVTELVGEKKRNVWWKTKAEPWWHKKTVEPNIRGIRRDDITRDYIKGKDMLMLNITNRKSKERRRKIIPISVQVEKELIRMLDMYLNQLGPQELLFKFGKTRAYQVLQKYVEMNPHWLRHIRCTHLVTNYDFSEQHLVQYLGWADGRQAKHYMELRVSNIVDKYPEDDT